MFPFSGIRIGRIFGIPLLVQPSWFLFLLIWVWMLRDFFAEKTGNTSLAVYPIALLVALLGYGSLLAHELGHAVVARRFGIKTHQISLHMLGGQANMRNEARQPGHELWIALAGPAVSLVLAALFGAPIAFILDAPETLIFQALGILFSINLLLGVVNLILVGFPLDGGHILRALLWKVTGDYLRSTWLAAGVGRFLGGGLIFLGFLTTMRGYFQGLVLVMIGFFVMRMAKNAFESAAFDFAFRTLHVRDLMRPVQAVVPATLSVRQVVQDFLYRLHADQFPVVTGNSLVGTISADDIARMDPEQWDTTTAERLARPYLRRDFLSPDNTAFKGFRKLIRSGRGALPVFQGGRLLGFLFTHDVEAYLQRFARSPDGGSGGFPRAAA